QPLPVDASPIALSPSNNADFNPEEDLKKDPFDGGDDDDHESSDDDEDDDEEEEHLSPAESTTVSYQVVDFVPSVEETELFETDESAATPPPPPAYRVTARMSIRSQKPMLFPSKEEVARLLTLLTPPPSPLTPLSLPLSQIPSPPTSPTYAQAPLSCRAAIIAAMAQMRLLTAPTPRFEVRESSTAEAAR
nr:hypothetical protein [Tanacetum cinerariifolium]